ncbi:serine protease [Herbaspirillum rhizosphaerae]|uniref:Serine protease n=1 Tax=Herbaspirillum rhizosphaerae TaxID=346179 RepID=A0ABW8ZF89_9BURK
MPDKKTKNMPTLSPLDFRSSPLLIAATAAVIGLSSLPQTVYAARWQEVGENETSLDKSYIDIDSVRQDGNIRVAQFMTVYEKARVNSHDIKMDRYIQRTAFDCVNKTISLISTVGYLDGQRVGFSPVRTDWMQNFRPLTETPFVQRSFALACTVPVQAQAPKPSQPQAPSTPPPRQKSSSGTGIIVNRDGYILTNNHVVDGCKSLTVKGSSGDTIRILAELEAVDRTNDLALIKSLQPFNQAASFRMPAKPARLGEEIGVIGYPLPGILSSEPKATFGQINSLAGVNNNRAHLQISAPIQPGNSGGPVLDASGAVVGVVVSSVAMAMSQAIGSVPQNVNFAIRGEVAQSFLTAHHISFIIAEPGKRLQTDEIAENGLQFTVQILCN